MGWVWGLLWSGCFLSFSPLGEGTVISNPFSSAGTHSPCWAESRVCPALGLSAHSALHRLCWPASDIDHCSTSMEQVRQPQSLYPAWGWTRSWEPLHPVRQCQRVRDLQLWGDGCSSCLIPGGHWRSASWEGFKAVPWAPRVCQASFRSVEYLH